MSYLSFGIKYGSVKMTNYEEQVTRHQLKYQSSNNSRLSISSIEDSHDKPIPARGSNRPQKHNRQSYDAVRRYDQFEVLPGVVGSNILSQQFR